jgi:hypothetical protein
MSSSLNMNLIKLIYDHFTMTSITAFKPTLKNILLLNIALNRSNKYAFIKRAAILKKFEMAVWAVAMSKDGNLLLGSNDGIIRIYDSYDNFTHIRTYNEHRTSVYNILILKRGDILTRSWDSIILWEPVKFTFKALYGHTDKIRAVLELENENIVSTGADQKVILWTEDKIIGEVAVAETISNLKLLSNYRFIGQAVDNCYIFDYYLEIKKVISNEKASLSAFYELDNQNLLLVYPRFCKRFNSNYELIKTVNFYESYSQHVFLNKTYLVTVLFGEICVKNIYTDTEQVFKYDLNFYDILPLHDRFFITVDYDKSCNLWYYNEKPKLINTFKRFKKFVHLVKDMGDYFVTADQDMTCTVFRYSN